MEGALIANLATLNRDVVAAGPLGRLDNACSYSWLHIRVQMVKGEVARKNKFWIRRLVIAILGICLTANMYFICQPRATWPSLHVDTTDSSGAQSVSVSPADSNYRWTKAFAFILFEVRGKSLQLRSGKEFKATGPETDVTTANPQSKPKPTSSGEYLKYPIIADYCDGADRMFLLLKTSGNTMWKFVPQHVFSTLSRFSKFAIYSDRPGSLAGYEVINILSHLPKFARPDGDFSGWREQYKARYRKWGTWEADFKTDKLSRYMYLPMLKHAYSVSPNSDWFIILNDNSYAFMDNLSLMLQQMDPDKPIMLSDAHDGSCGSAARPDVPDGIVFSRMMATLLLNETIPGSLEYEWSKIAHNASSARSIIETFTRKQTGLAIRETASFTHGPLENIIFNRERWCQPLGILGGITPQQFETLALFDKVSRKRKAITTYGSLYNEAYAPQLATQRLQWHNGADDFKKISTRLLPENGTQKVALPAKFGHARYRMSIKRADDCRRLCEKDTKCLSWVYITEKNSTLTHCGIAPALRLGRTTRFQSDQGNMTTVTSGWILDRVQRLQRQC